MTRHHPLSPRLERVARRVKLERACLAIGIGSLLTAAVVLSAALTGASVWPGFLLGAILTIAVVVIVRSRPVDATALAHMVERRYPELRQRLVTAVEQDAGIDPGGPSYLQHCLVNDVISHDDRNDWGRTVPPRRLACAVGFEVVGLILLVGICGWALSRPTVANAGALPQRPGDSEVTGETRDAVEIEVTVEPGDALIERGSPLLVTGRFENEAAMPADAMLELRRGDATLERPMSRSIVDPLFSVRLDHVEEDLEYRVVFAEGTSQWFQVGVYDLPRLERADATIELPEYTGIEPETIEDTRFVTALEGSTIELRFLLNKPVTSAVLKPEGDGEPLEAVAVQGEPNTVAVRFRPEANAVYRLHLTDADGRSNSNPPLFDVELVPNRRPDTKVTFPARDVRVSPIEEIAVDASTTDDFGVLKWGLAFSVAGEPIREVVLGEGIGRREVAKATAVLALEEHGAEPDQLVSYYLFADDHGPDGEVRRTLGDMFFAEVRSFEEIFREGQSQAAAREQQQRQQQQQQSQAAQQAEQRAAEQKEIVTATWNLMRRETSRMPSDEFGADVDAIREAQEETRTKLGEMEVTDPESQRFVEQANEQMTTAVEQLQRARDENSVDPLTDALAAEQAAYQSLLKLRAREHEVVRQGQQQQQQSGQQQQQQSNRSQQQLNELELRNEENRYQNENESRLQQAARDAAQQQRDEALRTLNRLRELARRQSAVNEKLRELESELRTAETAEDREEIERELKRLRDEQRELLRDVDQLRNENERNQAQQSEQQSDPQQEAETRRQLEETRERVRQASEALERGQTSQALSEGTRAERQLEQLREDFRRRTANEFEDEMRDLRDRARELSENQRELGERLEAAENPMERSLRTGNERREIEERLREQKDDLEGVLDDVRKVVEQAEEAEPVLSRQLYDTVRELRRTNPGERLEDAADEAGRGRFEDARSEAATAGEGIEQLREGIERAAEGVVGDSTEALRRARDTLRNLERELDREVVENDPRGEPREGERRPGEQQPGERRTGEGQPGERQPGERQPGNDSGERQPGEGQPAEGEQPGGERRGEAPPMGGQPMGGQPMGGQPMGGQPMGGQPMGGQPMGGQPMGGQPMGGGRGGQPGEDGGREPMDGESARQDGGRQPNREPQQGQPRQRGLRGGTQRGGDGRGGAERASNPDGRNAGPLTGDDYQEWSDQLRIVEELVDDPELRGEAARIRERARAIRAEFERHSKEPKWDLVRDSVLKPLVELERKVAEEVARRRADGELVPIDRDPVPEEYRELVRRYYEELGEDE